MIARLVASEFAKIRRKGLWFLVFLGSFGVVGLQMVNYGVRKDYLLQINDDHWGYYLLNVASFTPMALVLGIVILTSLLSSIEEETNTWKQMLAMPVSKLQVYLAKMTVLFMLLTVATVLLILWTWGYGLFLPLEGSVPYGRMVQYGLYPLLAAMPILALQLWLATVSANQALPITVGIFGVILTYMNYYLPDWLIWKWPSLQSFAEPWINAALGMAVGVVLYLIGMFDFQRRDVK